MKKLIALLLVLTLTLGVGAAATAADDSFKTELLDALDQSVSTYYASADTRAMFCVLVLLDYMTSTGTTSDTFDYTKTMYLQKYSDNMLCFYIGAKKGGYYELVYWKSDSYSSASYMYWASFNASSMRSNLSSQQGSFYEIKSTEFLSALTTLTSLIDN